MKDNHKRHKTAEDCLKDTLKRFAELRKVHQAIDMLITTGFSSAEAFDEMHDFTSLLKGQIDSDPIVQVATKIANDINSK